MSKTRICVLSDGSWEPVPGDVKIVEIETKDQDIPDIERAITVEIDAGRFTVVQ